MIDTRPPPGRPGSPPPTRARFLAECRQILDSGRSLLHPDYNDDVAALIALAVYGYRGSIQAGVTEVLEWGLSQMWFKLRALCPKAVVLPLLDLLIEAHRRMEASALADREDEGHG